MPSGMIICIVRFTLLEENNIMLKTFVPSNMENKRIGVLHSTMVMFKTTFMVVFKKTQGVRNDVYSSYNKGASIRTPLLTSYLLLLTSYL